MDIASSDVDIKLTDDFKKVVRVAAAATLLLKTPEWLAEHPDVAQRAHAIINAVVDGIGADFRDVRSRSIRGDPEMEFAAHVVAENWIPKPSKATDEAVMRIMTSGDDVAVTVLFTPAFIQHVRTMPSGWMQNPTRRSLS